MSRMTKEKRAARTLLYTLFHRMTSAELDEDFDGAAMSAVAGEAASLLGLQESEAMRDFLGQLEHSEDAEAHRREYMRLFVGPAKLAAPPWESVYAEQGRSLFTATTLEVRNAYRAMGMLPAAYPQVADDHLAIELSFMARLAEQMDQTADGGDEQGYGRAHDASEAFLDQHLLKWIDRYAADIAQGAKEADGSLYPSMAQALAVFLRADRCALEE